LNLLHRLTFRVEQKNGLRASFERVSIERSMNDWKHSFKQCKQSKESESARKTLLYWNKRTDEKAGFLKTSFFAVKVSLPLALIQVFTFKPCF